MFGFVVVVVAAAAAGLVSGAEKAFDKIQYSFKLKVLEGSESHGPYLNIIKATYSNPVANIKTYVEKFEAIPLKLETGQG